MLEFDVLNEVLDLIATSSRAFVFVVIWAVGWFLKNHTQLKNERIPQVLMLLGAIMGFAILSFDVYGIGAGIVIVVAQLGAYDIFHSITKGVSDPDGFKAFINKKYK